MLFNPQVLSKLIHEAPERTGQTIKRTAERMGGVDPKYLSRQINPDDTGAKLGVEDFVYFLEVTDLAALDYIEEAFGRFPITIAPSGAKPADVVEGLGRTSKEFGDVVTEFGRAMADGRLDAAELDRLDRETYEHLQQAVRFWMKIREMKSKGVEPEARSANPFPAGVRERE